MSKNTHKVLSPIKHNGKDYAEGAPIELTEEEAAPLLEVFAVSEGIPVKEQPAKK